MALTLAGQDLATNDGGWRRVLDRGRMAREALAADPVTDEMVERVGRAIHGYACGCMEPWPVNANVEEMARAACSAAFSTSTGDGKDSA